MCKTSILLHRRNRSSSFTARIAAGDSETDFGAEMVDRVGGKEEPETAMKVAGWLVGL